MTRTSPAVGLELVAAVGRLVARAPLSCAPASASVDRQAAGRWRKRSTCWAALATLIRRLASRTASDSGVRRGGEDPVRALDVQIDADEDAATVVQTTIRRREAPRPRRRASAPARSASRSSAWVLRTVSNASSSAFFSGDAVGLPESCVIVTAPVVDRCLRDATRADAALRQPGRSGYRNRLRSCRRASSTYQNRGHESPFGGQEARQWWTGRDPADAASPARRSIGQVVARPDVGRSSTASTRAVRRPGLHRLCEVILARRGQRLFCARSRRCCAVSTLTGRSSSGPRRSVENQSPCRYNAGRPRCSHGGSGRLIRTARMLSVISSSGT